MGRMTDSRQLLVDIAERMGPPRAMSLSENFSYYENEGQKEDVQNGLKSRRAVTGSHGDGL